MTLLSACLQTPERPADSTAVQTQIGAPSTAGVTTERRASPPLADSVTDQLALRPTAGQRPYSYTRHGITVQDPWDWLRDRSFPVIDDPDVLAYLKAENEWFKARMAPHQPLIDALHLELKGRVVEDEESVPQRKGHYEYWWAFDAGAQYRKWYRRPVGGTEATVILDEPAMAAGQSYFNLGGMAVSPDGRLLAFAVDETGGEHYTLRVRDLETGQMMPDEINNWLYGVEWAADSKSFLYTEGDGNWRSKKVWWHRLGENQARDTLVYEEKAEEFGVSLSRTQSQDWIVLSTGDHSTNEQYLLPAQDPGARLLLVAPRQQDRRYEVDERQGILYIRVNDTHPNFRIATAPIADPQSWSTLIPGSDQYYLQGLSSFENVLAIQGREKGLARIFLHDYDSGQFSHIPFTETSHDVGLGWNPEYRMDRIRLHYSSMTTPDTTHDYDVASAKLVTLKVQEIPSGYDPTAYDTERRVFTARDGTEVPVSLVYRKGFPRDGSRPLQMYAYGAYGNAVPPAFSATRLSLLDRGYAFAIAHVRGGDDLGHHWYLDGRRDKRANTFNDFVDAARFLIQEGYTSAGRISASGGSAGGELVGAVINQAPELFGAVAAHVPFVDVLNTMLDASLPLTPGEWKEWGNPITDKTAFEYIRSYSPYDQVRAQDYPHLLVTAGLNDPRVTYWEPAKWVARLRATKTGDSEILFKTNMGAGHGGLSGRFDALYERAEEIAFFLIYNGDPFSTGAADVTP